MVNTKYMIGILKLKLSVIKLLSNIPPLYNSQIVS